MREEMFVKADLDDKLGGQATSPNLRCHETKEAGGGEEGVYLSDLRQICGTRSCARAQDEWLVSKLEQNSDRIKEEHAQKFPLDGPCTGDILRGLTLLSSDLSDFVTL